MRTESRVTTSKGKRSKEVPLRNAGLITAFITAIAVAFMPSAAAGGGTWEFEGIPLNAEPVVVAGEPVHAYAPLWLKGVKEHRHDIYWAGPEQGPFYAYVVPRKGSDWADFPLVVTEEHIYVGEVMFSSNDDPRVMDATLDFVMPDLEPGYYGLVYCNDPCTRLIGDTMPTRITVVENRGQALITNRLNRMNRTLINMRARSGNRVKKLENATSRLPSRLESLQGQISALEDRVELATRREPAATSPWGPFAVGAGAVSLVFAATRSRFIRRRLSGEVLGSEHSQTASTSA